MITLLFATNNTHKLAEVQAMCPAHIHIIGMQQAGYTMDIPEPYHTFEANAQEKCRVLVAHTGLPCFAEDSGLLIDALDGAPGVLSARYAGTHGNHEANIAKVLTQLQGVSNRAAHFKTVISLYLNQAYHTYVGECHGTITEQVSGSGGFGYDPIFVPNGYKDTFAILDPEVKNNISHRSKAFEKLVIFLNNYA